MISDALLALLRCPQTRKPLKMAPADLLIRLQAEYAAGRLRDVSGKPVVEPFEGGLVREDGALFFLTRNGIPVLLLEESIRLSEE